MGRIAQQLAQFRTRWDRLTPNQRVAVIGVALTALFAVTLLLVMQPPQRYAPVYTNLSGEDAAAIVEQLRQQGVPYRLSADGTTVSVPADRVADVRLALASLGLPKGGSLGFELFDRSSFGVTDFAQRVNYQRAIEGELQRTISRLDAVSSARVHIVIPEESLFAEDQQPTSAAVVLQLKPGRQLTEDQVRGIVHLVSSAVPGLQPEHLTIVDDAGNPIWSGNEAGSATAGMDEHLKAQRAYETTLATQLQAMIARIVGNGNAAVQVHATLDWDQRSVDSEIFSPNGTQPQVRSQQERVQTVEGNTTGAIGVPGVDSNVQTFQEGAGGQNQQRSELRESTTNYEVSRQVERVVQAPGQLERLSVAVVLNGSAVDPTVAQQVRDLVAAAAGIVPERGDSVTVSVVPFSATTPEEAPSGAGLIDRLLDFARIGVIVLIPLVALLIAWRVLASQRGAPQPVPVPQYRVSSEPLAGVSAAGLGTAGTAEIPGPPPATPPPQFKDLQELARRDPAVVAQLVRSWLNEE
ncbi:flagellar M-ring protein FliF [Thermomicrobiaceae bacterium CFH 74404]|uniref:Flagellar M-ring protein n=1 Tax=Thermalbibacter longus TaxID=2951981 RepID=A0AA41WHZ6_9BACT|nr:flagellar basal-body MS-ring/collar protein FliF [Thermalbibacter longus]MCM8749721.1 flagellar M-ring protein FliF [Thermalbibacter longus]